MMHEHEKSDLAIVAVKPANKVETPPPERSAAKRKAAEPVERRAGTKGNADQQSTYRTQSRASVSQALERIRQAARERVKEKFTALFHHINTVLLTEAFFQLEKNTVSWRGWADLEGIPRKISRAILRICTPGSNEERIGHCRHDGARYLNRTVGSGR